MLNNLDILKTLIRVNTMALSMKLRLPDSLRKVIDIIKSTKFKCKFSVLSNVRACDNCFKILKVEYIKYLVPKEMNIKWTAYIAYI